PSVTQALGVVGVGVSSGSVKVGSGTQASSQSSTLCTASTGVPPSPSATVLQLLLSSIVKKLVKVSREIKASSRLAWTLESPLKQRHIGMFFLFAQVNEAILMDIFSLQRLMYSTRGSSESIEVLATGMVRLLFLPVYVITIETNRNIDICEYERNTILQVWTAL
ncbi:uncharacterized protein LOC119570825, partial [Penaeus monodon]|uniref:uncharacterized protein LOC119570825 n=1 Tax=Penaeus monodon TaxID=6687 RepID=UPI0018A7D011